MVVLAKNYDFNNRTVGDQVDFGGTLGIKEWTGAKWVIVNTTATMIASMTGADKPSNPQEGMIIYNSDVDRFEGYMNNEWVFIGSENVKALPKSLTISNFYFNN